MSFLFKQAQSFIDAMIVALILFFLLYWRWSSIIYPYPLNLCFSMGFTGPDVVAVGGMTLDGSSLMLFAGI